MRRFLKRFAPITRRTNRTILGLMQLEGRETPAAGFTAAGVAAGAAPIVTVSRPDGSTLAQITAYDPSFLGGVHTAVGEIDGNPNTVEVVTGAGAGGGPHVKVFSVNTATGAVTTLASFMAYDPTFAGGVSVATGSFGITNVNDVITGAGPGGGPHVRVFSIANGTATQIPGPLGSFMAFDPAFAGGVNVAAGNLSGALAGSNLIVGAGPGGGPHVRVLDAFGNQVASFMAFAPTFPGGVSFGNVGTNQLTVNSLTGGGVTQFGFGPGGVITPAIITPITSALVAATPGLLGTGTTAFGGAIPGLTGTNTAGLTTGLNTLLPVNPIAVSPTVNPTVTSFNTLGTGLTGTTSTVGVTGFNTTGFNNLGFSNLTPAQVAAASGAFLPGLNPLTTNPLISNLTLPG